MSDSEATFDCICLVSFRSIFPSLRSSYETKGVPRTLQLLLPENQKYVFENCTDLESNFQPLMDTPQPSSMI